MIVTELGPLRRTTVQARNTSVRNMHLTKKWVSVILDCRFPERQAFIPHTPFLI